jgi:hypothetical protein
MQKNKQPTIIPATNKIIRRWINTIFIPPPCKAPRDDIKFLGSYEIRGEQATLSRFVKVR